MTSTGTVEASGPATENSAIPRLLSHLLQHQMPAGPGVSSPETTWDTHLEAAAVYRRSHGDLSGLWSYDRALMKWVQNQRISLNAGRLPLEREQLLDARLPGWRHDGRSAVARYATAVAAWLKQNPGATVDDITDRAVVEVEGQLVRVGRHRTYYRRRRRQGNLSPADLRELTRHGIAP